jgi:hypothetical protein
MCVHCTHIKKNFAVYMKRQNFYVRALYAHKKKFVVYMKRQNFYVRALYAHKKNLWFI